MDTKELQNILNNAASTLGEHFGSVLILVSRTDTDDISHFTDGMTGCAGDWYAQQGMAKAVRLAKLMKDEGI